MICMSTPTAQFQHHQASCIWAPNMHELVRNPTQMKLPSRYTLRETLSAMRDQELGQPTFIIQRMPRYKDLLHVFILSFSL